MIDGMQMNDDVPRIGESAASVLGSRAEIVSGQPLRATQVAAALENSGVEVTLSAPQSALAASFHRAVAPEQPQPGTAAQLAAQPANIMTKNYQAAR